MGDFSIDDVQKFGTGLALLVPGALILYVRSLFLTGRRRTHSEEALSYVIVTLLYFAVFLPLFGSFYDSALTTLKLWAAWVAFIFLAPIAIGLLIGLGYQKKWGQRLLSFAGLDLVHPVPTAWDWKFGQRNEHWLILKMKDDTTFYGYYGRKSFASSDDERDIYIEQIFNFDGEGNWKPLPQGLWVQASEISTIEFLPVDR